MFQHETFRDECFVMGFLQDDQEFIDAIKEAHNWGSGIFFEEVICHYDIIPIYE